MVQDMEADFHAVDGCSIRLGLICEKPPLNGQPASEYAIIWQFSPGSAAVAFLYLSPK